MLSSTAFVLIAQGFLSAAYHICPSQATFQFGELIGNLLLFTYCLFCCYQPGYCCPCRHHLHVHHGRADHPEDLPEQAPGQCTQCQLCLYRILHHHHICCHWYTVPNTGVLLRVVCHLHGHHRGTGHTLLLQRTCLQSTNVCCQAKAPLSPWECT